VVDETASRLARFDAPASGSATEPQPAPPAFLVESDDRRRQVTPADAAWIVDGWRDDGWQT
jgi:hypothetical protein